MPCILLYKAVYSGLKSIGAEKYFPHVEMFIHGKLPGQKWRGNKICQDISGSLLSPLNYWSVYTGCVYTKNDAHYSFND